MPIDPTDFEGMLELLDDKMVRTSKGSYISVEDLRGLVKDTAEIRKEERTKPRPKTMHAARVSAMQDEELVKMFGPPPEPSTDIPRRDLVKERQAQSATSA